MPAPPRSPERTDDRPRHVWIVANPTSGRARGARWAERARGRLEAEGVTCDVLLTQARGEAEEASRSLPEGVDGVWAVGGDGTINELIQGLAGQSVPLSVLPAGTGNVVARELGIPLDCDASIDWALDGEGASLDLGCANGRWFLFMFSAGLDASVVHHVASRRQGGMSLWHYGPALWASRKAPENRFQVTVDGTPIGGVAWAAAFNVQRYAGLFRLCPGARVDSRDLSLLTLRDPVGPRLRRVLWAASRTRLHQLPDAAIHPFSEVTFDGATVLQMDGDVFADAENCVIKAAPAALPFRGPPLSAD